jgi:hypothetical protein
MPKIAEFFGIAIYLYYDDHPPPHFHARYGGQWATIAISGPGVVASDLPPRALGLVLEWAELHAAELMANWQRAANRAPVASIEPLRQPATLMTMQPIVVEARPLPGYRLWVRFADGTTGEDDLSHLVGHGVFQRWEQPGEFERVRVDPDAGTVVWPGDLDIAPDALYERIASRAPASTA